MSYTHITRVQSDNSRNGLNEPEWTITVRRLSGACRWYGPPSAADIPADVRQALIEWAASPERESEEDQ